MSETNPIMVKLTQKTALMIFIGITLLIGSIIYYFFMHHAEERMLTKTEKSEFQNPLPQEKATSYVLEIVQKQMRESEKRTQALQQELNELKNKNDNPNSQLIADISNRMSDLEKKLTVKEQPAMISNEYINQPSMQKASSLGQMSANTPSGIREDYLQLSENPEAIVPLKNPDTYVPAGTFVKAVMIGGADASAAVNSQSNPVPMLFRLVADGTLPNHKKSHLKDCVVTAAVVGDISSERGLIRLENLSCTFPNNEVVDQSVEGTIFGTEGKNGVRGIPVWREGALLQRAFAAGTLSGISDGISQTYTSNSISPEGAVQTVNSGKIFQYGVANGTGKAMDKLADYNIQRAEQYHPVIQLSAGTVVDVVFLKGFYLDGKKHEVKEKRIPNFITQMSNRVSSFPPASSFESKTSLLSEQDVKRIQEQSKALGLNITPA